MGDKYYGHTISQMVDEIKIEPLARSSEENSTVHLVNAADSISMIPQQNNDVKGGEKTSSTASGFPSPQGEGITKKPLTARQAGKVAEGIIQMHLPKKAI